MSSHQHTLFLPRPQSFDLEDGTLCLYPEFLSESQATALFQQLLQHTPWRQDRIRLFGREVPIPRLQAWYGEADARYRYSNLQLTPLPWTPELQWLRQRIERLTQCTFNSVLINLYRDGDDHVSWHSDDEPELGANPVIASVSLGAPRPFVLRHKQRKAHQRKLVLESGSLLVMGGALQHHWQHRLPKTRQALGARINLTFRRVQHEPKQEG